MKFFIALFATSLLGSCASTPSKSYKALDRRNDISKLSAESMFQIENIKGRPIKKIGWRVGEVYGNGDIFYGGWMQVQVTDGINQANLGIKND